MKKKNQTSQTNKYWLFGLSLLCVLLMLLSVFSGKVTGPFKVCLLYTSAQRRRSGSDRRIADQESGRRSCADRRLCCRKSGSDRKLRLSSDFSGTRKRSRSIAGRYAVLLSGIFPCADCCMQRVKRRRICSQSVRTSRI